MVNKNKKGYQNIKLTSSTVDGVLIIAIGAQCEKESVFGNTELDTENVALFETYMHKQIAHSHIKFIVDLTNITNIYSYGMSIFFNFFKNIQLRGGDFKLFNPSPTLMQTFDALHVSTIFEIHTNLAKAVASFKK